jgi:spore coat protein CotH
MIALRRYFHLVTGIGAALLAVSCHQQSVPEFFITTTEEIGWEARVPCEIFFDGNFDDAYYSGRIKYRGGFSSQFEKTSYSVELERPGEFAALPRDDDWVLNASYIDKTFMRHKICYDLFQEMDSSNLAAQSIYVDVEVNEEEQGLYILMEEVNAAMAGLDRDDPQAVIFKDPPVFYRERLPEVQEAGNYYQQKYPKITMGDKTAYLEAFRDFIFHSADSSFVREIADWVDVKNIMDWHLLLLLSNNGDGIMKNFYWYKRDTRTPFRIAIWDYDHSFGRDGDNELNMAEEDLKWWKNILLKRLMEIEETGYRDALKDRWQELRESGLFTMAHLREHVRKNDERIGKSAARNFELWPPDSKWYFDDNGYREEIDLMLSFMEMNIRRLDTYMDRL